MNRTNRRLSFLRSASAIVTISMVTLSAAAQSVPALVNYQGRLNGVTGAPLAAGSYVIQFRLWNDPTANVAANLIWSEQQSVTLQTNGAFNVIMGTGGAISGDTPAVTNLGSAFGSTNVFLGVTVTMSNGLSISSPSEILPRQQLLSVPFAVQAQFAAQAQLATQAQQAQQAQVSSSLVTNLAYALCPAGSIMAYMGTSAPPGWLICDGSLVSRTQYPALFSIIGTASGSGDGATTFNLPDMRGMFLRGLNGAQSNTNFADPDVSSRTNEFTGGNVGNALGSVQTDQFKSHTHTFTDASLAGSVLGSGSTKGYNFAAQTGATGGNETRPKNIYVNYIIKY